MTTAGIRKVLVIDDDPDILALAEIALSDLGDLVTVLYDSAEAALAEIHEIKPDLILLDLFLPGLNGRAMLERIRADPNIRDVPVVIMTAQLDNTELVALHDLKISGVVKKPFDPETLAERLPYLCGNA